MNKLRRNTLYSADGLKAIERTIWQTRPDLREKYRGNYKHFLMWLFFYGAQEYKAIEEGYKICPPMQLFDEPATLNKMQNFPYFTEFMLHIYNERDDLQALFDVSTEDGQAAFIRWYFLHALEEYDLIQYLSDASLKWLLSSVTENEYVPNLLKLLWENSEELKLTFPNVDTPEFIEWVRLHGMKSFPILEKLLTSLNQIDSVPKKVRKKTKKPFGVNLIGYAKGQLGIGEDVRMAALACEAANIPYSIFNVEPGQEVQQGDFSCVDRISDELPYFANVFCVTGIELSRLIAETGEKFLKGYYCIGYWPWELPSWPEQWLHAYQYVDEVWASSRFTYQSFISSSPVPVRHMPMAVDVSPTDTLTRGNFNLPNKDYLFVFSFDFLSSSARKNPEACIEAFQQAFPNKKDKVGLVVKAMRAEESNPTWQKLKALASRDSRIHIINQTLSRAQVLDLYRECDCFVSLHRSEGFGRGLADAMMLGKPVICTGCSGNMDFTVPGTAGLVDHSFTGADDYPFGEGQYWAEPSVESAAWWMQRFAENKEIAKYKALAGKVLVDETYSPIKVGENYKCILKGIFKNKARI